MSGWLTRQRKQTLLDLSEEAGLPQAEEVRKDVIVEQLDRHLQANASRLHRNATFEPYYSTRRTPFKAHVSSAMDAPTNDDGDGKGVKARRRTTRIKLESEYLEASVTSSERETAPASQTLATRTPARRLSAAIPASPADVADDIELASRRVSTSVGDLYARSGINESIEFVRQTCSSVSAVQTTFLLLEAYALHQSMVPWRYAFTVPGFDLIGSTAFDVSLPDLFVFLTGVFWSHATLWAFTSIIVPTVLAYFYNFGSRNPRHHGSRSTAERSSIDPLSFNIGKAIMTYIVYVRRYTLGLYDDEVPRQVEGALFGGATGAFIASGVGILVSLYEAAQKL